METSKLYGAAQLAEASYLPQMKQRKYWDKFCVNVCALMNSMFKD